MPAELTFHGAAGQVTGSCYRFTVGTQSFLIDCGLFQGNKSIRELNYNDFPFTPHDIDAVLLTHAHVDHCGLLPKLARQGFKGPIHATQGTIELAGFVLPDSGHIQEIEVERLNQRNNWRGRNSVEPIYTRLQAENMLRQFRPHGIEKWFDVIHGVRARFWDAGHILGAVSIELEIKDDAGGRPVRVLVSGDIGQGGHIFHEGPDAPKDFDYVITETTYGDRLRPDITSESRRAELCAIIRDGLARGGPVLIPAFAVERTQELLHDLDLLFDSKMLPPVEVFVDSPLATHVTGVFERHLTEINQDGTPHPFRRANLHFTASPEESRTLSQLKGNAIILAGSGMCDAGRIRHHLRQNLWRHEATVILVGYQAPGTLGRLLVDGKTMVRIQGDDVAVRAKIHNLEGYSGHADQNGLRKWLFDRLPVHGNIFLMHGEEEARKTFAALLRESGRELPPILLPKLDETVRLAVGTCCESLGGETRLTAEMTRDLDWHNEYVMVLQDLYRKLQDAHTDPARHQLLDEMRAVLARAG